MAGVERVGGQMSAMDSMRAAIAVVAVLSVVGCGSGSFSGAGVSSNGKDNASSGTTAGGGTGALVGGGSGGAASSGAAALPPETKVESSFQTPVSTRTVVWSANPTSGRVAYINSQTFDVQTVEAGDGPTYLAAIN